MTENYIAFKIFLNIQIEAPAILQGGNARIRLKDLFRKSVRLGIDRSDLPFLGSLGILFPRDVIDQLVIPIFALGERFFARADLFLQFFRRRRDLGDALFDRLFLCGQRADVLPDLGKVFDRIDDALLRAVGKFFVFGKFRIVLGDFSVEHGNFLFRIGDLGAKPRRSLLRRRRFSFDLL